VTAGFDVIIVGGGPAGATAARSLARGGARALVLDRAAFPRNKPCGGGLTWRALKRFPDVEAALPRISTHAIRRIYMEAPGGASVSIDTAEPTVVLVRRIEFDHLLMTMARDAGAELAEGADITRVSEHAAGVRLEARDGRVFEAPIVVAADGVYSTVARRLGFNPGWPQDRVAIDMMEETPSARLRAVDDGTLWVSFALGSGHGYGYIFPKRDYVNVGVGYVVSAFKTSIREAPHALHEAFVDGLKERGLLEGDADRSCVTPYQVPVGGPLDVTARGRVYLAGDAGGFVNAFSAEGIHFAMVTGDLAARAILAGPSPRLYERLWRREIGAEMRDARFLSRYAFADLTRVSRLVRGVRAYPPLARLLADYASGTDTYEGVRRRFVLKFPRIGAKLAVHYLTNRS
jgi:geranylgeranyl reductase family protein